ncbi:MAG: response regulator [Paludibacteraceae bacterium]|nr:response regulator [Paludibacteraceae bacterium]
MKNTGKGILALFMLIALQGLIHATGTKEYARFKHFTTKDGLASNRVFNLAQDSTGFVWVATDFGLERFDGINFKHHQKKDYPNLHRNDIMYVGHIGHNRIVVGGFSGVFQEYDRNRDDFIDRMPAELDSTGYTQVRAVYISEKGEQYLQTNGGIYHYDKASDAFNSRFPAFEALKIDFVNTMYVDQRNRFWVGSINKLHVIDEEGKLVRCFDIEHDGCGYVSNIIPLGDGKVVVTFLNNELWLIDTSLEEVGKIQRIPIPFHSIMKMIRTDDGRYWFATDGDGLWYTDDPISPDARYKNLIPYGEAQNEIKKIYGLAKGNNGEIWIGTQNSGIWSYSKKSEDGVTFSGDIGFPTEVCSSFQEDKDGTIIVGTDGDGIYTLSGDMQEIKHYDLPNNNVTGVYAGDGKIVTATWGAGLLEFNPKDGSAHSMTLDGITNPIRMFFSVGRTPNGVLWACTANDDLYLKHDKWGKLCLHDDSFPSIVSKWIAKVIPGKDSSLWVLSTNMLWHVEGKTTRAIYPELFMNKSHDPLVIFDAVCDQEGNLFATSNHGIYKYSSDGKEVKRLDFLPNYFYRIIIQDLTGRFWAASFDGIISFDCEKEEYSHLQGDYNDIAQSFFYIKAGFRDSKGRIYFGTNGGFYTFDPAHIVPDTAISHMGFSELYVSRKKIAPGTSVLEAGNIADIQELTLNHGGTDITIAVDVIDHAKSNKVKLRYRLKGMQEDWIEMDNTRHINFNHIPTGDYVLEVEAFRPYIECVGRKITMKIHVLPPWWSTWWFRLLMTLLVFSIILLIFRRRMRKLEEEQIILQKKVDERTTELKQALQDKDRLISVIAHDLKNPMFAIVGALETWLGKEKQMSDTDKRNLIGETYQSSVTLQREMLKLLDWAKSKRDEIICHPSDIDLKFVTNNVILLLKGMMEDKKITLEQHFRLSHYAYADSRMMGTAIRNLLSNAIKFTPREGTIRINGWQEGEKTFIEIADSGVGMSEEQLSQLLNGGNATTPGTENEKGTGLGFRICQDYVSRNNGSLSVKSKQGEGTTILITLPSSSKELETVDLPTEKTPKMSIDKSILEGNTLLVVDDDPLICNNIKSMMDDYLQTIVAKDGKEALEIAEKQQPDVILSDVEMPNMNGIEMSQALGQHPKTKHIPILFISARNEESDRLLGLLSGAIDYIAKPFSQSELLLKLANILDVRQKHQQKILSDYLCQDGGGEKTEGKEAVEEAINPFLKAFLDVVKEKYTNSQTAVEDLAKGMAVSQPTLNRKIRSMTGKTPLEVLTEYRLNTALKMLQDTHSDANVSDVAYDVGFNDPSYFTKKFRDFFGYLPSKANQK